MIPSVSSAVGILPLSLQYGFEIMSQFLAGAHDMDEHFMTAPLEKVPTPVFFPPSRTFLSSWVSWVSGTVHS